MPVGSCWNSILLVRCGWRCYFLFINVPHLHNWSKAYAKIPFSLLLEHLIVNFIRLILQHCCRKSSRVASFSYNNGCRHIAGVVKFEFVLLALYTFLFIYIIIRWWDKQVLLQGRLIAKEPNLSRVYGLYVPAIIRWRTSQLYDCIFINFCVFL